MNKSSFLVAVQLKYPLNLRRNCSNGRATESAEKHNIIVFNNISEESLIIRSKILKISFLVTRLLVVLLLVVMILSTSS